MALSWIESVFGRKNRNREKNLNPLRGIYSITEMQRVLLRERGRVDRNGHEFSLLILDIHHEQDNKISNKKLFRTLRYRLRSIDEVGWFSENQISIVLLYTSNKNAMRVAKDILDGFIDDDTIQFGRILTYPSLWPYKKREVE